MAATGGEKAPRDAALLDLLAYHFVVFNCWNQNGLKPKV